MAAGDEAPQACRPGPGKKLVEKKVPSAPPGSQTSHHGSVSPRPLSSVDFAAGELTEGLEGQDQNKTRKEASNDAAGSAAADRDSPHKLVVHKPNAPGYTNAAEAAESDDNYRNGATGQQRPVEITAAAVADDHSEGGQSPGSIEPEPEPELQRQLEGGNGNDIGMVVGQGNLPSPVHQLGEYKIKKREVPMRTGADLKSKECGKKSRGGNCLAFNCLCYEMFLFTSQQLSGLVLWKQVQMLTSKKLLSFETARRQRSAGAVPKAGSP